MTADDGFVEASGRACIRALRSLEQTAIMLEQQSADYYPAAADGKVHFIRAIMESAAESIRSSWASAIKEAELFGKPPNEQVERLMEWVGDLQSGMYVNCVYCGHRYGPGETTPVTMAEALTAHIATCPAHPLSHALTALQRVRAIRPDNWNDGEDPDQQLAWEKVDEALRAAGVDV